MEAKAPVDELEFFNIRLPLLSNASSPIARKRCQDRTTEVIRRLVHLREETKQARAETVTTLEATESKDGVVVLRIPDRVTWDRLQDTIKTNSEQMARIEDAIRELDVFVPGREVWYTDLDNAFSINQNHASQGDRDAKAACEVLKPHLERLKSILTAVGC